METKEIYKRLKALEVNRQKICGYLSDYEIDKAIETEDFNFIGNTLFDYFEEKDIGYILNKFENSGLKDKVDDVDFSLDDWYKVQKDLKDIKNQSNKDLPKNDYVSEMVEKRQQK